MSQRLINQQTTDVPLIAPAMDKLSGRGLETEIKSELYEVKCDLCGKIEHHVIINGVAANGGTCYIFKDGKNLQICHDCSYKDI